MIKKSVFGILVLLVMFGCTPRQQFVHHDDLASSTPTFTVSDKRPQTEKIAEVLSINAMNDNYGIYRIGDSQLTPDRVTYLTSQLSGKANNRLVDKDIVVKHFEIHNNLQKVMKQSASFGVFGLTGGLIAGVVDNPDALIDIKLHLTIDRKPHGIHVVRGYNVPKWEGATDELVAIEIYAAMDEAIDRVVSDL